MVNRRVRWLEMRGGETNSLLRPLGGSTIFQIFAQTGAQARRRFERQDVQYLRRPDGRIETLKKTTAPNHQTNRVPPVF